MPKLDDSSDNTDFSDADNKEIIDRAKKFLETGEYHGKELTHSQVIAFLHEVEASFKETKLRRIK